MTSKEKYCLGLGNDKLEQSFTHGRQKCNIKGNAIDDIVCLAHFPGVESVVFHIIPCSFGGRNMLIGIALPLHRFRHKPVLPQSFGGILECPPNAMTQPHN